MADAHKAKVICLAQYKGGTGKTSSVINLAACLQKQGEKVLVVDLDQQANLTAWLGHPPEQLKRTVKALLLDEDDKVEVDDVLVPTSEGFDLLPASIDLVQAEMQLQLMMASETQLRNKLVTILDRYSYILLDTPPAPGKLGINAMTAADYVLVPVQPEPLCLQGLEHLNGAVNLVRRKGLNHELKLLGVFVTLYDRRREVHKQMVEHLKQQWKSSMFDTMVRQRTIMAEAAALSQSVISYAPASDLAQDYQHLTKEVIERVSK